METEEDKIVITKKELEAIILERVDEELQKLYDFKPETIKYLANLRVEDIKEIQDSVKFVRQIKAASKIVKYMLVTIFVILTSIAALGDVFIKIKGWLIK